MYVGPITKANNTSFGYDVHIDRKILNMANREEGETIKVIKKEIEAIETEGKVSFGSIIDFDGYIVGVTHELDGVQCQGLSNKSQPISMKSIIAFFREQKDNYADQFLKNKK